METTEAREAFCPLLCRSVVLTETWALDGGYGCAVSAELFSCTCSAEVGCPHASCPGCLLRQAEAALPFGN